MAQQDSGQKTEKPTPKKLRDARKKGQIPKSVDLAQWLTLLAATFILPLTIGGLIQDVRLGMSPLMQVAGRGEIGPVMAEAGSMSGAIVIHIAPLFGLVMVATIIAIATQGGVVISSHPLKPKWERISPKTGFKRLFSLQSLVDTLKALVRLAVLALLVSTTLVAAGREHLLTAGTDIDSSAEMLASQILLILRLSALAGVAVGIADYGFQRWNSMKKMKMTKHEVKQESKSTDGDPMIRQRRRAAHSKLSRNQMLAAIPDASVIVVNPTHYSVAVTYAGGGGAPKVVAKGVDELAWRIRAIATTNGVPIVESPPLARALHATVDVGDDVPEDFYEAVAAVLAFIMRRRPSATGGIRRLAIPPSKLPRLATTP